MKELGHQELYQRLAATNRGAVWSEALRQATEEAFEDGQNGNLPRWQRALELLPDLIGSAELTSDRVTCRGSASEQQRSALRQGLEGLKPWRKGPFELFDVFIDTEWQSNLKWNRLAAHLDLEKKDILDVGCGNGYYGWRMLGAGAASVVGLDPNLLFVMQHAALRRYLGPDAPHYIFPAGDTIIPTNLRLFDTVFSMGVLYHRRSPIDHLLLLGQALKQGGQLILETLIIDGDDHRVLIPEDRYAQMNNVWFLPTCPLLVRMLERCGFKDVRVVDVSRTTVEEQRSTEWMTFESLPNFLDPADSSRTVEGYQAPTRAILLADR